MAHFTVALLIAAPTHAWSCTESQSLKQAMTRQAVSFCDIMKDSTSVTLQSLLDKTDGATRDRIIDLRGQLSRSCAPSGLVGIEAPPEGGPPDGGDGGMATISSEGKIVLALVLRADPETKGQAAKDCTLAMAITGYWFPE